MKSRPRSGDVPHLPSDDSFPRLLRRAGRNSRYAGLFFIVLSIVFLILSVANSFVVFEVDSIVSFLAAIFLLFRDPSARVQANVLDAVTISSDMAITDLASRVHARYTYMPLGDGLESVVIVPDALPNGTPTAVPLMLTPPGRALALLYQRTAALDPVTIDALKASLSDTMREQFGLARSVDIQSDEASVTVTLDGATIDCTCGGGGDGAGTTGGSIGCVTASFFAVLVAAATGKSVSLEPCFARRRCR